MITLLYVDDEPTLLDRTRAYLEQAGYYVHTAGSAREALTLVSKNTYDVIIADYLMPEMDGIGLLRKIRETGVRTPFIILVGKNQEEIAVNALRSDADFYLEKRVSFWADLPRAIESIRKEQSQPLAVRIADIFEESPVAPVPAPARGWADGLSPELRALLSSLEPLENPVFAIDTEGRVIVWNAAITRLTGISADTMVGRSGYAYAVPFYGQSRPMLVDYILKPHLPRNDNTPPIVRNGDVFMMGTEHIILKNKPVLMTGKGTAVANAQGDVIAAVQSVVVSDPLTGAVPESLFEEEQYIGGISSGVAVMGVGSTVPGAIRTDAWKYGLYATDRRLFVVDNLETGAKGSVALPAMPFIVQKIFGGKADEHQRSLQELIQHKVFEISRKDIASVTIRPEGISVGCFVITLKNGESFHLLIARKQALSHLDWILRNFYPEIPRTPGTTRSDSDLVWLDELWMRDLIDKLQPEDPLRGIGEPSHDRRRYPVPEPPAQEEEWSALVRFAEKNPFPLFAIDRAGTVIVWNEAVAKLTGVSGENMIGKGGYAHAVPFYGRPRPMLVDSLIMHRESHRGTTRPGSHEGEEDTVTGDPEEIRIGGRAMRMQEKATCIYDENGEITAAIQSVIISEMAPGASLVSGAGQGPDAGSRRISATGKSLPPTGILRQSSDLPKSAGVATAVRAVTGGYPAARRTEEKPEGPSVAEKQPAATEGEPIAAFSRESEERHERESHPRAAPVPEAFAYRVILDAHEGIMAYNRELRVTVWNRFMEDLTGLDAASAIGRQVADIFPVIRDSGGVLLLERALDGQTVESPDLCIRLPTSGKQVWVRLICSPLSDVGNRVIGGVGIIQDATARKVMECALESTMLQLVDSEEKYRNVFNATNEPLILIDTITKGILDFNNAASHLYGYSRQELLSMSILDLSDGTDQEGYVEDTQRPHIRLCHHRKKDGTAFPADVSTAVFELKGRSVRILSVRDLSVLRQNAEALRLANSKLNLMIGITRHDVLNKITVLVGFNELLKGMITDPDAMEMIKKQGKMMQLICSQIEFTREYDNLGAKAPQWQNVQKTVLRTFAQFPGCNISLHCDTGDLELFADPLLEKVFYNLFDNALRYARGMTGIRVFSIMQETGLLLIFEDDGPGIPPEEKERIFERGYGRNTGLGLFFIKEILSMTDITIRETGEPGHGARFTMVIPQGKYRFHTMSA